MSFCVKHQFSTFFEFLEAADQELICKLLRAYGSESNQAGITIPFRNPWRDPRQDSRRWQSRKMPPSLAGPTSLSTCRHQTRTERPHAGLHAPSIAIALLRAWGAFIRPFCVPLRALTRLQLFAYSMSRLACLFARKRHLAHILTNERPRYDRIVQ